MSFVLDSKIVLDETAVAGRRYMALRHCVEKFSPLGFERTWAFLAEHFGLKSDEVTSNQSFVSAINFLIEWRYATNARLKAEQTYKRSLIRLGFSRQKYHELFKMQACGGS